MALSAYRRKRLPLGPGGATEPNRDDMKRVKATPESIAGPVRERRQEERRNTLQNLCQGKGYDFALVRQRLGV